MAFQARIKIKLHTYIALLLVFLFFTNNSFASFIHTQDFDEMLAIVRVVCIFVVATTVVLLNGACPAAAQTTCDPAQLGTSCGPAFFSSTTQPTTRCCNKLREQQPCYCAYLRNPQLKPLVDSAAARRIAKACKIQFPTQADCPN